MLASLINVLKSNCIKHLLMSAQTSKVLMNIQGTLNEINEKLSELRELDRGSKSLTIIGLILIGLSGGGLITLTTIFKSIKDYLALFASSTLLVLLMIAGYMLAHKGLTGDWL